MGRNDKGRLGDNSSTNLYLFDSMGNKSPVWQNWDGEVAVSLW